MSIAEPGCNWAEQKELNSIFVLELIRILVEGHNENTATNQNVLGQSSVLLTLLATGIEGTVPGAVRSRALLAAGDLIRHNDTCRDRWGKSTVMVHIRPESNGLPNQKPPPGTPTPSELALIQLVVDRQSFELRSSAAYTFRVSRYYLYILELFGR